MDCKRCKRCGCFFVSTNDVCPKCELKDNSEIIKLRNYLDNNEVYSLDEISSNIGITQANLVRHISSDEFKNVYKNLNKNSLAKGFNNISISL